MIHGHKLMAVCDAKLKAILNNMNILVGPLLAVFFTLAMRFMYSNIFDGPMNDSLYCMILNLGLLFNICMTGMFITSLSLAEEKEKHTLRTLMTSSVSGIEFFLGSILPPMFIMIIINVLLLPVSGISLDIVNLPSYLIASTLSGVISCILGMVLGIFAKSQASASTLTTPAMLLFLCVPMFGSQIESLQTFSGFLFTGAVSDMVYAWNKHAGQFISLKSILVLVIELILITCIFLYIYKRNGFEKD